MKNKNLIAVVVGIIILLTGIGVYQVTQEDPTEENLETSEMKTVGILQFVSHPALDQITAGIKEGLAESGYVEGENLQIAFQNGQADQSKLDTMSQQLVQEQSDVLIGVATPAAQALANTTDELPILLGAVTDPVGAGLVADTNEPGGNVTGVSDQPPVKAQIELAHELLPDAQKVGILYSSAEANSKYQVAQAEEAAANEGLAVNKKAVSSTNEIAQAVQVLAKDVDFIYVPLDNTIASAMETVVTEADKNDTPVIPSVDTMVEQGGLATVGINQKELGIQTGKMAAEILDGNAEPATTPIYTFTEGDTIINEEQLARFNLEISTELEDEAKLVTTTKGE
ncbi:MAG: tryptophan ABC transporter substrate-binding protein [Enterococcus sp.]